MKKRVSLLLAILMVFAIVMPTQAAVSNDRIDKAIQGNYNYLIQGTPQYGSIGGEWTVMALGRSGLPLPDGYIERYNNHIDEVVRSKKGDLHKNKYTEYSRLIVALGVTGKDVTNVGGYNLLEPLAKYNEVLKQGINGPIWALIAYDTKRYEIPKIADTSNQNSRERMIENILSREIVTPEGVRGGWALMGNRPDPDITAMALYSLWPYYNSNPKVKEASDRAVQALSDIQLSTGGYTTFWDENSESSAQVIIALTTMGIDPDKDHRFIKYDESGTGHSVLDAFMTYQVASGGFKHIHSETSPNAMGTDQATEALLAVKRFREGKTPLFDYTDLMETGPSPSGNDKFADIAGHWAKDVINATNGYGINGGGKNFQPDRPINRAEFAVAVVNGMGLKSKGGSVIFPDVNKGNWYAQAVTIAAEHGIVEGHDNGTFAPNANITREQAMAMIQRAVKAKTGKAQVDEKNIQLALGKFSDANTVSPWAREAVAYNIQTGLIKGRPSGIAPRGNITRAESVQVVNRTVDVK